MERRHSESENDARKGAKRSRHMKENNPALKKVVQALRSFVKKTVPGTKVTMNAWGIPTFEDANPFCLYMVGKTM
jgi:uncharacterized protein YdhG (YjbR/CyaY superfamily)